MNDSITRGHGDIDVIHSPALYGHHPILIAERAAAVLQHKRAVVPHGVHVAIVEWKLRGDIGDACGGCYGGTVVEVTQQNGAVTMGCFVQ